MELTINDHKMKELLQEALIKMLKDNRENFYELVVEAIEEVGLANAINKGRQNKFIDESDILKILES